MSKNENPEETIVERAVEVESKAEVYDLNIGLPGESKDMLKDAAELA